MAAWNQRIALGWGKLYSKSDIQGPHGNREEGLSQLAWGTGPERFLRGIPGKDTIYTKTQRMERQVCPVQQGHVGK